jgi:hypothetical protein
MFEIKPFGDWSGVASKLSSASKGFAAAADKAILREAHRIRTLIIRNLQTGGATAGKPFAPHSPLTFVIRKFTGRRGGTKPLMTTIGLGSVVVLKQGSTVFVGVRKAKQFWRDASTHEYGATFNTTARQQRFLGAALRASGLPASKILVLKIPPRPFVGPVIEKFATQEMVTNNIRAYISEELGGFFG